MSDISADSPSKRIVNACIEANKLCTQSVALSLDKGDGAVSSELIRALTDCAELSRLTADFMSRASHHAHEVTALCARVSKYAAEIIDSLEREDDDLRPCYSACLAAHDACSAFGSGQNGAVGDSRRDEIIEESFPASDPPQSGA